MTLEYTKKLAKHICRLLKVTEINFPIGRTPKGNLGLVFNANNNDFDIMLDSVPLSTKNSLEDENNIELKRMIEKYWFEEETPGFVWSGHMPAENSASTGNVIIGIDTFTGESETWIEDADGVRIADKPTPYGKVKPHGNSKTKKTS